MGWLPRKILLGPAATSATATVGASIRVTTRGRPLTLRQPQVPVTNIWARLKPITQKTQASIPGRAACVSPPHPLTPSSSIITTTDPATPSRVLSPTSRGLNPATLAALGDPFSSYSSYSSSSSFLFFCYFLPVGWQHRRTLDWGGFVTPRSLLWSAQNVIGELTSVAAGCRDVL